MDEQIKEGATEVYETLGTQYGVASVPAHTHDDISTPSFPVGNLQGYYKQIINYAPATATTATLDLSKSNINHIQMPAGNITIALSGIRIGQCFIVRIKQDSGGSRTVTWFSGISWPNNTIPTLSTSASHWDTFGFEITSLTTFDGFTVGQNLQ